MNELIDAAVEYAKRDWRVIALHYLNQYDGVQGCSCKKRADCNAAGKHPVFNKWREVATTDPDRLRAWWKRWPRANVGLLMGGVASLVCVDIDGDDGRTSLAALEHANGTLPATRMQSTGREGGGEHRLFHVDPFYVDWIKNRARVAPGLDFRSEGGLIVAAPSLHASGNYYRWRDPDYPIAELPDWMFKLALSKREVPKELASSGERPTEASLAALGWPLERRMKLAREALAKAEPAVQGQNGSLACYRAAIIATRGYCIPVEGHNHVFDLMWEVYNPICMPSWSQDELIHKIHDAERLSIAPWGFRWNIVMQAEQYGSIAPTPLSFREATPVAPSGLKEVIQLPIPIEIDARRIAPKAPSRANAMASIMRTVPAPPPAILDDDEENLDD